MTLKERKEYYKNKIYNIGLCNSVKKISNEDYEDFLGLFKYHPEYPDKIKGIVDVIICKNNFNPNYYELNIKRENGEIEDISYLACCRNKIDKEKDLKSAMRYSINPQIQMFRNNNKLVCSLCNSINKIEIDHYNKKFRELYQDFIKNRNDIPTKFDNSCYNNAMFKQEDETFKNEWYDYHLNNASLRCLCKSCNLKNK